MPYICQLCGSEYQRSQEECDRCTGTSIEYENPKSRTAAVEQAAVKRDENLESSPDVQTDGSLSKGSDTMDNEKTSRSIASSATATTRSGMYKIRAYLLAPFHIIWMYKQAILAFLLVFGVFVFFLF